MSLISNDLLPCAPPDDVSAAFLISLYFFCTNASSSNSPHLFPFFSVFNQYHLGINGSGEELMVQVEGPSITVAEILPSRYASI